MYTSIALMFGYGFCMGGKFMVAYIYLLEFIPKKYKNIVGPWINASEGFSVIFGTLVVTKISKNVLTIEVFTMIDSLVLGLICLLLIPESPQLMYA